MGQQPVLPVSQWADGAWVPGLASLLACLLRECMLWCRYAGTARGLLTGGKATGGLAGSHGATLHGAGIRDKRGVVSSRGPSSVARSQLHSRVFVFCDAPC